MTVAEVRPDPAGAPSPAPLQAVVVGTTAAADGMVGRLRARGMSVGQVDPNSSDDPTAAFDAVVAELGAPGLVVVAHLDPAAATAGPLVEMDPAQWDAAGERSIRVAVQVMQATHRHLPDEGRVVVVLPSVATVGVPGLVPMCTAVEAIRMMAKVAARRWGGREITVNIVLVPLSAFLGEATPPDAAVPSLGAASLSGHDPLDDAAGLVAMLAGPDGAALTGATLGADAGTVLQP